MDCQGIEPSPGVHVFGTRNLLTLSARAFPKGPQLAFEKSTTDNLAMMHSGQSLLGAGTHNTGPQKPAKLAINPHWSV
jgi:hypothetical protein